MLILKSKINLFLFIFFFSCAEKEILFDSDLAMHWIEMQCKLGPRFTGSDGNKMLQKILIDTLTKYTDDVKLHRFSLKTNAYDKNINGSNIIASINPKMTNRILLSTHYDTNPISEKDKDSTKQSLPLIGANDGASGIAVIMTTLIELKKMNLDFGVDIILFDAEDLGTNKYPDNYCIGSKEFAKKMKGKYHPFFAINIDMMAAKNAEFLFEANAYQRSKNIADKYNQIWEIANTSGFTCFRKKIGHAIYDDHIPLIEMGIPAINIIDNNMFNSNSVHHTQEDNIQNVSKNSIHQVGQSILNYLRKL